MKDIGIQLTDGNTSDIDLKIEVVRGSDGLITQGLGIGSTLNQNRALILIANPGEFKFEPTLGVAIDELLFDTDYLKIRHRIRDHFPKNGLKVKNIELSDRKPLWIDASYE
jgi:hypothetical protein